MSIFSERLRSLRSIRGQTQKELGKLVGKSRETICKYEIGDREPDLNALDELAKYFGVTTDYILGRTDEPAFPDKKTYKNPYNHLREFETHLKDRKFLQYIKLAVRIKDNDLDFESIEKMVNNMIKFKNKISSNSK
ncbi:MAG TPA: helix-turn-helix transcriptional regulator [Pseudobacteroides sp.]|uniref:helix-turn-helix domain-containing protein n=1 Tax=Pseudobacteroides sp. TaxID=1968840 RepID=UPI002F933B59